MAALAATHLVDYGVFGLRYQVLDAGTHASLFGALSLLALAVAAVVAIRVRPALAALLAILLVLRLASFPHVLVVAVPFLLAALVLMWRLSPLACVLLVVSYTVHGPGEWVVRELGIGYDTWVYQTKIVLKHACELGGWMLLTAALLAAERRPRRALASRLSAPEADQDPGLQELPGTG
jgi:hypothetical protein